MRQAGRYMQEYRQLREKYSLLEMFHSPELAAEITLQPVKAFEVDAAILFSDILIPLPGMGIGLDYVNGKGPVISNPIRSPAEAKKLRVPEPEEQLAHVLESIRLVRGEIKNVVPLIGFAGAPFTLASYLIEGGTSRGYLLAKKMMYEDPKTWDIVMGKLTEVVSRFLRAQIKAGVQAVQLFDSWAGYLNPMDYQKYVFPYSRRVFLALQGTTVPSIHFGTGTGSLLNLMREAGGDVIGLDWRVSLDVAWSQLGYDVGVQGNLDPVALMAPGPVLKEHAVAILDRAAGRPGHIFNLGHGILPSTPVESVKALVDLVHEYHPSESSPNK
jgi:uroporphyrinogen decarboxylase